MSEPTRTTPAPHPHTLPGPGRWRERARRLLVDEDGAATAEYAIATMAAVAFAGLLVVIMRSEEVRVMLEDLVRRALTIDV